MNTEALSDCPVCGARQFQPLAMPGRWIGGELFAPLKGRIGLVRCRTCHFTFTNPRPDSNALDQFYSGDTYVCHSESSEDSNRGSNYLLSLLGPHLLKGQPGRLLDFGCGAGRFLSEARAAGWEGVGYEPGQQGREATARRGLQVEGDLLALPDASFDAVTVIHVFEHMPDFAFAFNQFKRLLKPNGLLCLEVPNCNSLRARLANLSSRFDERYRAFPIHLSYFSAATLRRLLQKSGWIIEQCTTVGFGIEELVAPSDVARKPVPKQAANGTSTSNSPRRSFVRRTIRNAFMGAGLGENLVVICLNTSHPTT